MESQGLKRPRDDGSNISSQDANQPVKKLPTLKLKMPVKKETPGEANVSKIFDAIVDYLKEY